MAINTYLNFDGQCKEALEHYAQVLGGKIAFMMTFGESPMADQVSADSRNRVMHASLVMADGVLMGSDAPIGHPIEKPQGFAVSLSVDNAAEAERIFAAFADGGTVDMPLSQTFWAHRFGMLTDRFNIPWMISCEQPR